MTEQLTESIEPAREIQIDNDRAAVVDLILSLELERLRRELARLEYLLRAPGWGRPVERRQDGTRA